MSTWYDAYWSAVKAVIGATWTDVQPKYIFQDNQVERIDWTQRANDLQLSAPWVAVKVEAHPTSEWGAGPKYEITATAFYITTLALGKGANLTATEGIMSKLVGLQLALYASQTMGTVLDDIDFDATSENPVNMSFLGAKLPYQAGSITFKTIVYGGA
jgi:hypothetical protein